MRTEQALTSVSHADPIRAIIHKEYKISDSKAKNAPGIDTSIVSVPLGQDRNKARIWSFDSESESLELRRQSIERGREQKRESGEGQG